MLLSQWSFLLQIKICFEDQIAAFNADFCTAVAMNAKSEVCTFPYSVELTGIPYLPTFSNYTMPIASGVTQFATDHGGHIVNALKALSAN